MKRLLPLALLGLVGCFVPRQDQPRADRACVRCHGDETRDTSVLNRAAPPTDTFGNTAVSYPGVGAHVLHLTAAATHGPVPCGECHRVPELAEADGHNDGVTQVVFGAIGSKENRLNPRWDLGSRTCTNSGCHGRASGVWTRPRSSDEACGSCHGLPPPLPHPQYAACHVCHADVASSTGFQQPALHVDGFVQVNEASCAACHGSTDAGAPPRALDGGTERSHPGVGAHTTHLAGGQAGRPVACGTCHLVPARVVTATHPSGGRADVLASVGWDAGSLSCATACHGGRSPAWTSTTPLTCSGCHASPPPAPHPQATQCALCHRSQADGGFPDRDTHVNGTIDAQQPTACNACHGSAANDAPPRALSGETSTTVTAVGAHQAHLQPRGQARPVACAECHLVPATVTAPGHLDGVTQVRFSGVARANQSSPVWNGTTCGNAGCHDTSNYTGAPNGGMATTPQWTVVDGSQRQCTSCHGMAPSAPHPPRNDCGTCHLNAVDGGFVRPELHINGRVEFTLP